MHVLAGERKDVESRRDVLQSAPVFSGCSLSQLTSLAHSARFCRHAPDAIIVSQEEPADELYLVASGCVRVLLVNADGRELTLAELRRHELFGEAALVGDAMHSTTVVAVDDVRLLALSRSALLAHVRQHPATGALLALELARRTCAAQRLVGELALLGVEERVVRALERLAQRDGEVSDGAIVLRHRPTHHELAAMVGISRETLTRTFSALAKRGLLSTRGSWLKLCRERDGAGCAPAERAARPPFAACE